MSHIGLQVALQPAGCGAVDTGFAAVVEVERANLKAAAAGEAY